MNTAKQVNVMIGLLFVGLIGTFLYFVWENGIDIFGAEIDSRQDVAAERQEKTNVERGAHLFSLNCRSCHGLKGEGVIERGGLPGAPLNVESNRPPEITGGTLAQRQRRLNDTITCGRNGTVMPPWHTDQGGPLNFFQIEQLVLLITSEFALEGWEFALEESNHADLFAVRKQVAEAIGPDDDTITLTNAIGLEPSTEDMQVIIRIGGDTLEEPYELFLVADVDQDTATLEVERGTDELGTEPIEHEAGSEVYNGPIAPGTTITGEAGGALPPTCGQNAVEPAESPGADGDGAAETIPLTDGLTVEMGDNFFEVDGVQNPTFALAAGATVTVTLENVGAAIHNMASEDQVSEPDAIAGGETGEIELAFADPGTYEYVCEFHPTDMVGEIVVE
jgi:plastocyanin/mono/diheme cytochrome c family protein